MVVAREKGPYGHQPCTLHACWARLSFVVFPKRGFLSKANDFDIGVNAVVVEVVVNDGG